MSSSASARIVSSVPGRLRIRDDSLKNPARLKTLGAALAGLERSCSFQANPAASSLTVFYDPRQCAQEQMEAAVAGIIAPALAGKPASNDPATAAAPTPVEIAKRRQRRNLLRRTNRYSKYAMLASLGVSLALAARGATRGHALTGAAFVAALGVHLAVHRRQLLN
jgi:hypothetical protein